MNAVFNFAVILCVLIGIIAWLYMAYHGLTFLVLSWRFTSIREFFWPSIREVSELRLSSSCLIHERKAGRGMTVFLAAGLPAMGVGLIQRALH
jgi:hypothetical protein